MMFGIMTSIPDIDIFNTLGIEITTPSGRKQLQALLLTCLVDLPARALVLNMKQYNGKRGCSMCEDEGQTSGRSHFHRFWPYTDNPTLRSQGSMVRNAKEATGTCNPVSTCTKYNS